MSTPISSSDSVEDLTSSSLLRESPLHSMAGDFRPALDEFRNNWQREIHGKAADYQQEQQQTLVQSVEEALEANDNNKTVDQQVLAESYFRKAVELEQRGKVYDALPLYRKAVQMVPDIEFKFYEEQKLKMSVHADTSSANKPKKSYTSSVVNHDVAEDYNEAEFIDDLYEKFQIDLANDYGGKLLLSNRDAGVITTELHMSDLPTEILLYILRWVVSSQLDMHSLEQCAAVCKGLYLCARDDELWRLACEKVWGINLGTLENPTAPGGSSVELIIPLRSYSSWRQMFIERDRVLFNGCYISKTTYLRLGENSFQDQYYRPVQLVEYYRYIRFLPDGTIYMMTNADEPAQGVTKLKHIQQLRPDVLRGEYRIYDNTVTILLKKQQQRIIPTTHQYARQRRGSSMLADDLNCTKYCIEFRIMNTPKRKFTQLAWQHYSIVQTRNRIETSSEFDLVQSKYPPLWFSPVRSYHLDADSPLA